MASYGSERPIDPHVSRYLQRPLRTLKEAEQDSDASAHHPVSLPSLFGNGQLPFVWPIPKILSARSTLQVQATNYDAAVTYNLRGLYFIGVKLFPIGG
jgi:hypothetical protein